LTGRKAAVAPRRAALRRRRRAKSRAAALRVSRPNLEVDNQRVRPGVDALASFFSSSRDEQQRAHRYAASSSAAAHEGARGIRDEVPSCLNGSGEFDTPRRARLDSRFAVTSVVA